MASKDGASATASSLGVTQPTRAKGEHPDVGAARILAQPGAG